MYSLRSVRRVALLAAIVITASVSTASAERVDSTVECDRPLVQAHLGVVLDELRNGDTSELNEEQRTNRAEHIETLAAYREACEFPVNTTATDRITPIFVDEHGVHCAVGFLMASDGEHELVERIRSTDNYVDIWELSDDPEVGAWLQRSGLSLYEAARIQPGYGTLCNPLSVCFCHEGSSSQDWPVSYSAVARGTIVAFDQHGRPEVQVDVIHGASDVEVGDHIVRSHVTGDRVNDEILFDPNEAELRFEGTIQNDTATCAQYYNGNTGEDVSVPVTAYVDALLAEDCNAALQEYDETLKEEECVSYGSGPGDGCSTTGIGSIPLGVLGLLGVAMMFRRRRA